MAGDADDGLLTTSEVPSAMSLVVVVVVPVAADDDGTGVGHVD